MKKVLITGASGFVGWHLAVRCQKDSSIELLRLLVRDAGKLESMRQDPRVELFTGDITDPYSLSGIADDIDTFIHCAAIIGSANIDAATYHKVNVAGTKNIAAEAVTSKRLRRFVYVSTVGVYGDIKDEVPDESYPPKPTDDYERSKLQGEQEARSIIPSEKLVVVRPTWVYGPGDNRTGKLIDAIAKKRFLMVGSGMTNEHPVYVSDLAEGLYLAATLDGAKGIYNIGGNEVISKNRLCSIIADALGVAYPKLKLPGFIASPAALIFDAASRVLCREMPFDSRKLGFFIRNKAYSIERAKNELGYKPKMTLEQGTRLAVKHYLESGRS